MLRLLNCIVQNNGKLLIKFTAGTGPVVPSTSTGTSVRLSYSPGGELDDVTVPWLNVVPGGDGSSTITVAKTLVVTYQYYNPKESVWVTKSASVTIPAASVPAKTDGGTKDIYNPGYQYIYNVRILGQEGDDAEVQRAQIVLDGVTVTPWTSESVSEVKTDFIGSGKNLKTIVEGAAAFSTITLTKDVDLTDCGTINVTKSMTIDLAGYTITAPASGVIFNISEGAKVVIKGGVLDASAVTGDFSYDDGQETKAVTKATINAGGVIVVRGGAELTLEKSGENTTTITLNKANASCIYVTGSASKVTVNAGSFTNSAEGGKTIAATDDVPADNIKVTGSTIVADYSALNAAATDETTSSVILSGNIEVTSTIEISKDFTIDLNGNTVTSSASCHNGSAFDVKAGTVTIQNGTIDADFGEATSGETDAITVRSGATANLNTLTVDVKSKNGCCAYAFDGGQIYIASGTYTNSTTEAYQYRDGWQGLVVNQANVTNKLVEITAGTFVGQNPEDGDDSWSAETCTSNNGFIKSGSTASYDSTTRTCTVTAAQNE